ncbi:hypothetical protein HO173_004183 [Letharia columbiana]|uniref:Uncharacterized protein n=1 Tax=Letharia columbiana TaxID=112416 RepID=A0A8H6L744_9LECA|nr:uncharacterized protein HO173_004183 [Letharia columbiana]KAF6237982.1 hypothetical protein HO173_004183 [Letharia columbiana]
MNKRVPGVRLLTARALSVPPPHRVVSLPFDTLVRTNLQVSPVQAWIFSERLGKPTPDEPPMAGDRAPR